MFEYKKIGESAIMKKQAEYVWRESVIELLPLRNGRENLGRKYIWHESVRTVIGLLPLRNGSRFIASVLSAMKIHDEYRLNGTKITSK